MPLELRVIGPFPIYRLAAEPMGENVTALVVAPPGVVEGTEETLAVEGTEETVA